MIVKILAFGIARDIVGGSQFEMEIAEGSRVVDLQNALLHQYPRFGHLTSLMIAVNEAYGDSETLISSTDELALIPPVSGG